MERLLTRDLLTSDKARTVPVERLEIPELGGHVFVRGMTAAERDEFERSIRKPNGEIRGNFRARLVVRTLVDDKGERIFNPENDVPLVGRIRVDILQRICNCATKLSGISEEDAEELGQGSDDPAAGNG